jgi:hypothetical protein
MRRIKPILVAIIVAPIGWVFASYAFLFSRMVLSALWMGVLERPDFRENTGDVRIVRATDPDWFWSNIEFYSFLSLIFCLIAAIIAVPLTIYLKRSLFESRPNQRRLGN